MLIDKMEINLTEEKLKVGKYECDSVTIYDRKSFYELELYNIKSITERKLLFWKGLKKTTENTGQPYLNNITHKQEYKTNRLKRKLKVKSVKFIGMIPSLVKNSFNNPEGTDYLHSVNQKRNYINFYQLKSESISPPKPEGMGIQNAKLT